MAIVYTVTDVRFKFRIAVAPLDLSRLTFYLMGIIGFGTLLTDVWIKGRWLVPESLISQPLWAGIFGFLFFLLIMTWIYYAVINPPIFGENNYQKYAQELFKWILKGSDAELPVIASELARSAEPLVRHSRQIPPRWQNDIGKEKEGERQKPNISDYAYDMLLLIGNRRLCKYIIASSPQTAIIFFKTMATAKKYDIPIGQFAKNISTEAIINKDSILYHEDEGYDSGLIGYLKPFSQTIYGNFKLVEELGLNHSSPFDILYEEVRSWDASQLEAYSKAVQITFKNYLDTGQWGLHSFALKRALNNIKDASCLETFRLNDIASEYHSTDIYERFRIAVKFTTETITIIEKHKSPAPIKLRTRGPRNPMEWDFYDHIAAFMLEIICSAATIKNPPEKCWSIHFITVWGHFFGLSGNGEAWKIIRFKLRRLLFDEIRQLETFPNYHSSKILGFCLNVMGLKKCDKKKINRAFYPLRKAVLSWTTNNYLRLRNIQHHYCPVKTERLGPAPCRFCVVFPV